MNAFLTDRLDDLQGKDVTVYTKAGLVYGIGLAVPEGMIGEWD